MAKNVYIAFQSAINAGNTFKTWNSTNDNTTGEVIADLLDESGVATGWTLSCNAGATGRSSSGVNALGSGDAAWVDEAVISDEFFYEQENVTPVIFEFSGLDDGKTYDFELFASWASASGNRRTEISVDGFSSVADTVESQNNSTNTAKVAGVSPSSGSILFQFRRHSADGFGHCNAIWIRENDGGAPVHPFTSVTVTG